ALASEAIVAAAGDEFAFRLVDRVAVKGKAKPVQVYELLGLRSESGDALARLQPYERALHAYFHREFAGAIELLRACPHDGPSRVLALRCQRLLLQPPAPDWDGVFVASSK